jgi:hypothetical protein
MTNMVKTIPPLRIRRPKRGTAPDQKVSTPSSLKILAAHWKLFLYRLRASIDCILSSLSAKMQSRMPLFVPCLDRVYGHSGVDCDDASETTEAKCAHSAQLLARGHI